MLSIQPLQSAEGAAAYYTAAFNYYAGDATAMKWLGKGAEILNLSGEVKKEQMLALLSGVLPDGTELKNNSNGKHRPGFDMTFSAPKSVSVLIGLDADKQLETFHDEAVIKAQAYIEKEFAETRIKHNGIIQFQKTGNFITAAFRQPSSRANDPDTHTHCVTMNITFDLNGKARSLASDKLNQRGVIEQLQRAIKYAGLIYRTELANRLKESGYKLESRGEGLFEIANMPEEVLREFSKRREEIEQKMAERNWHGAKAASAAALLTRNTKEEHDITVLKADWQKRANALGFDAHAFVKEATTPEKPTFLQGIKDTFMKEFYGLTNHSSLHLAREAVEAGIEIISQKTSVFSRRDLVEHALKHCLLVDNPIKVKDIHAVIDSKIEAQTIYQGKDNYTDKAMLTTPWQLTLEAETLARIQNNQAVLSGMLSKRQVTIQIKMHNDQANFPLTPSQASAITDLLSSQDRFMAVQGFAGTGKTTMLRLAHDMAKQAGFEFRGLTVSSSAANELTGKAGIKTDVFPIVYQEILHAKPGSLEKRAYIVDEASMLSSPQGHELMRLIEQKGARMVLVGDDAQLPSVKNGRIFGLSQEYGISTAQLTDIVRQKSEQLQEAVTHAIKGEIYEAVNKTTAVREFSTYDERITHFAESYLNLSKAARQETLLFAPTHKNRADITALIRNGLIQEGTLGSQEITHDTLIAKPLEEKQWHHARYYTKNDVIRFNVDIPRYSIQKGDYFTVASVKQEQVKTETLPLIREDGRTFNFKLATLPAYNPHKAGLERYIEIYQPKTLMLRENDTLMWTKNFKKEGVANSETATLISINPESLTVKLADGNLKEIEKSNPVLKHLDHGYVFTNYKVQGKDKRDGIGFVESYNKHAATLRNYYVQVSRGIRSITIITDNKTQLMRALSENIDEKKSAIDHLSTAQLRNHNDALANHTHSLDLSAVIDRRETKEQQWRAFEQTVTQYQVAKQNNHQALSAKLAFQIIHEPKLYRLAQAKLEYGQSVFRQDALKLDHIRYMKTLSEADKKAFLTVKAFVTQLVIARRLFQKETAKITDHPNFKKALEATDKRNQLAYEIALNPEKYHRHLAQFSIGKENRLGLSAHRIDAEIKLAQQRLADLSHYAQKYQAKALLTTYYKGSCPKKGEIAQTLQGQAKAVHRHLIQEAQKQNKTVQQLWSGIHRDANDENDRIFRARLTPAEQGTFDLAKQYIAIGREMKNHFVSQNMAGKEAFSNTLYELKSTRSLLGEKLSHCANDNLLNYFKLTKESLIKHHQANQYAFNVKTLSNPVASLNDKLHAAYEIGIDIKGHYSHIKKQGINSAKLNTYIRCAQRQVYLSDLPKEEVSAYCNVSAYKALCRQTSVAFKAVFKSKEEGHITPPELLNKAVSLASQRDKIASAIVQEPLCQSHLKHENITIDTLNKHAISHNDKVQTLVSLNTERESLLNRLRHSDGKFTANPKKHWIKDWTSLNYQIERIQQSTAAFHEALKEKPLHLSTQEKEIIDTFQLNTLKTRPPVQPTYFVKKHIDLSLTVNTLMANPQETYQAIFGEPKRMTNKTMVYSGGLHVTLTGSKAGLWYNFVTCEGGGPIEAIMHDKQVDFKEALTIAAAMSKTDIITTATVKNPSQSLLKKQEELAIKNKINSAQSIWKSAIDVKGTLAERYLKTHRGITETDSLNVKFWPKNSQWLAVDDDGKLVLKTNKLPALVVPAVNHKGEITDVQRIYLDEKTAQKNSWFENPKLTVGKTQGSAGIIQPGKKHGRLYLAEGPETAATLALTDKKATVMTSFGLGNIKNLTKIIESFAPNEVIIAGDNDKNKDIIIQTNKLVNNLQENGFNAKAAFPKKIPGKDKTDWNDVLQKNGIEEVKNQLKQCQMEHAIHGQTIHEITKIQNKLDHRLVNLNERINLKSIDIKAAIKPDIDKSIIKNIATNNHHISQSNNIKQVDNKPHEMTQEL